jgi:ubiquinone/menaquinone biosynthesis C-methylase UbiE
MCGRPLAGLSGSWRLSVSSGKMHLVQSAWERIFMDNIGVAFRDADPELFKDLVFCLDFMNGLDFFRDYKSKTWDSLDIAAGETVLDVACGVGFDIIELAKLHPDAQFVGVDISDGFLDIARERATGLANIHFERASADRLPFADCRFDAVRVDRSLQHMAAPDAALSEMIRVAREKARIVAAEPDWGTMILYSGDADCGEALVKEFRGAIRNPYIGRQLAGMFAEAGLSISQSLCHALFTSEVSVASVMYDLGRIAAQCVEKKLLTLEASERWRHQAESASRNGSFVAFLEMFHVASVRE